MLLKILLQSCNMIINLFIFLRLFWRMWRGLQKRRMSSTQQQVKFIPWKTWRPKFADECNQDIDHVDITDQLGNNYQLSRGLLQLNQWWPISIGVLERSMNNAYTLYSKQHQQHNSNISLVTSYVKASHLHG